MWVPNRLGRLRERHWRTCCRLAGQEAAERFIDGKEDRAKEARRNWDAFTEEQQIAFVRKHRVMVGASSGLGDEITYGFGDLNPNGYWQYACPWHERINTNRELFPELFERRGTP